MAHHRTDTADTTPDRLLLTEQEAAKAIGLSPRFLQARRYRGDSPRYIRISSRCVRYRPEDLARWAADHVRTSTSDRPDAA